MATHRHLKQSPSTRLFHVIAVRGNGQYVKSCSQHRSKEHSGSIRSVATCNHFVRRAALTPFTLLYDKEQTCGI
jgi:hypothetical protein